MECSKIVSHDNRIMATQVHHGNTSRVTSPWTLGTTRVGFIDGNISLTDRIN